MACVNENGQLNESAKKILRSIAQEALTPQDISRTAGIPLFKVRSSLREMKGLEFVTEENGTYQITAKASERLENS